MFNLRFSRMVGTDGIVCARSVPGRQELGGIGGMRSSNKALDEEMRIIMAGAILELARRGLI